MASRILQYKRRGGTSNTHGPKFEMDLTCLTYLRCYKLYKENKIKSFLIANNMDHVGAFDDIVCRIEYDGNGSLQTKLVFVQLKHCSQASTKKFSDFTFFNPRKEKEEVKTEIKNSHGCIKQDNGDKICENLVCNKEMLKYIESYHAIRKIFNENETDEDESSHGIKEARRHLKGVFNCQLNQCHFLYYTNAEKVDRVKCFIPAEKMNIVTEIFDTSSETGIQKLRLDKMILGGLLPENYNGNTAENIKHANEFSNYFSVYSNQEQQQSLEENIKTVMKSYLNENNQIIQSMYAVFYDELQHIFLIPNGPFLTEEANFVDKIHSFVKLQAVTTIFEEKYMMWLDMFSADAVENLYKELFKHKHVTIPCNTHTKKQALIICAQLVEEIRKNNKSSKEIDGKMKKEINKNCKESDRSGSEEKQQGVLFLYIENSASFEMWKSVRDLINYTNYGKVILSIGKEIAEDVQRVISAEDNNREFIISFDDSNHDEQPPYITLLSSVGHEKILKQAVKFQGLDTTIGEIFGDTRHQNIDKNVHYIGMLDTLIPRVLNEEDINICSSLPLEDNIYIDRKYKKCKYLLKYETISNCKDIFIIYPKQGVPESLVVNHTANVFMYEKREEAINRFEFEAEKTEGMHFCMATDSRLEVLSSKGNCKDSSKFVTEQDEMDEKTFLQHVLRNRFTILSDDVGMGKSTALKRMTHLIKNERNEYLALFIDLNTQSENLNTFKKNEHALEFIATKILHFNHMNKMIFHHKCNIEGNVALLFDGFDEIAPEYRNHFLCLIQALPDSKIKTIVVATRTIVSGELSVCMETACFSLLGFTYENMSSYLQRVWSINGCEKKKRKLCILVSKLVEHVKENKGTLSAVATVPLQTKMLSETFSDEIKRAINENDTTLDLKSLSLYSLYNNFIDMHIKRCIQEKNKLQESTSFYQTTQDQYKSEAGKWEALACEEMFPSREICELKATVMVRQRIKPIGIIVNFHPIKFVHRSYAEFLAAKYVSRLLYESQNTEIFNHIYQKILIDKSFVTLRKFMNACFENERHWETADIGQKYFYFFSGFDVDNNVLRVAVEEGNEFIYKVILRHLSKNENTLKRILNTKDVHGGNLLHISAKYCVEVFDDILCSIFFYHDKECDRYGKTSLHEACAYGRDNAVQSYINRYKNTSLSAIIDQTDRNGYTPLLLAAEGGHTNIVKILQHHGASIHSKDKRARTALMFASQRGDIETVKYLMEHFETESLSAIIDQTDDDMYTPLMLAAIGGHTNIIKILQHHGASIHSKNYCARTALHIAAEEGHIETVEYLIEQFETESLPAIINQTDYEMITPLMLAARGGHTNIVKILHHHGASIHSKNVFARTALHIAAGRGDIETVKYLIEQGAEVNGRDKNGKTAIKYAAKYVQIVKNLIEQGAEVNGRDINGKTAIKYAAKYGQIVKYLTEQGAEIN